MQDTTKKVFNKHWIAALNARFPDFGFTGAYWIDNAPWLSYTTFGEKKAPVKAFHFLANNYTCDFPPLRTIHVFYDNGTGCITDMAAHLTDQQMLDYFKIGRSFNIGSGGRDLIATIVNAKIID